MVSFLKALAYGIGGVAVTGVALLAAFQEKLVYVPVLPGLGKSYPYTPARLGLRYEDVWLQSSDGVRLHAWFIRHHTERAGPTVLFFQENAGNIAHRLEYIHIMLKKLRCNVFMLSYRGYGASDGYPSQHGIIKDAQAALNHLLQRSDIDASRVVVFGRSLGGAVGSVLVKNNPDKVAALILENTFTSILDMAGVVLPLLKWFIGGSGSRSPRILNFIVRSPWSTIDVIGQIEPPILFLSGLQDELVPPLHMQKLHEKAVENDRRCLFISFPTGTHMDTWFAGGDRYWRTIQLFLDQYASDKEGTPMQRTVKYDDNAPPPAASSRASSSLTSSAPLLISLHSFTTEDAADFQDREPLQGPDDGVSPVSLADSGTPSSGAAAAVASTRSGGDSRGVVKLELFGPDSEDQSSELSFSPGGDGELDNDAGNARSLESGSVLVDAALLCTAEESPDRKHLPPHDDLEDGHGSVESSRSVVVLEGVYARSRERVPGTVYMLG